ncbi:MULTISPECIES: hypothetical protein [unclassified Bradyrhizobium]|uniref:hypothetical protein n=2 Tax=unclassified Bradyrhizobium TaxID=2631580 RepID=UPI0028E776F2|nr:MULTISPECIES: hypothetical protein [unclassified Bradyrhizobium]
MSGITEPPASATNSSADKRSIMDRVRAALDRRRVYHANLQPAEKAARSTARATWAIALLSLVTIVVGVLQYITFGKQLTVMQGQLDAMLRDQEPHIVLGTASPPYFNLMEGSQDTGYVHWNVSYIDNGKGSALDVLINTFMSLDQGQFERPSSNLRSDPVVADEVSVGTFNFLTISSSSPIPKARFDSLFRKDHGIEVLVEATYHGDIGKRYLATICLSYNPNTTISHLSAAECQKRKKH